MRAERNERMPRAARLALVQKRLRLFRVSFVVPEREVEDHRHVAEPLEETRNVRIIALPVLARRLALPGQGETPHDGADLRMGRRYLRRIKTHLPEQLRAGRSRVRRMVDSERICIRPPLPVRVVEPYAHVELGMVADIPRPVLDLRARPSVLIRRRLLAPSASVGGLLWRVFRLRQ